MTAMSPKRKVIVISTGTPDEQAQAMQAAYEVVFKALGIRWPHPSKEPQS